MLSGENAGLHVVLTAREVVGETKLIRQAAEKGVKVYGLSESMAKSDHGQRKAALLLGFGGLEREQITKGVHQLKEAWGIRQ